MKIRGPRTLQARIMLLIAMLLMVGQYTAYRLFDYFEREPRAQAAALQVVSVVNLTRSALMAAHQDRRLSLLLELSQVEGVRVYTIDLLEEIEPMPEDPLLRLIVEKVREQLGPSTLISVNHLGLPGLWVSFSIDGDVFWVVIPKVMTSSPDAMRWLGWGVLVLLLSLVGAYFIAGRINRPLRLLANAAAQIARNEPVQKLPEQGAQELRQVSRAFNEMTDALARLDAERALLLAGVSHDLRTPLARMRLAVEMLPQRDVLQSGMVQDIEDMDNIIAQFLDFIRGVEGEEAQPGDLNALIRSVAERYAREGHRLQLDLADLPLVAMRPLAMQRLMSNLIDNALAYGAGEVEISSGIAQQQAWFAVTDHGPGIPEAELPRLLRPFERLDVARGRAGGSGLGLAIADRIARLHHGRLALQNLPQGGLQAKLWLPLAS